jgi:hypothetical protein
VVTMKGTIFWNVTPCHILWFYDVSEECTSIIKVKEHAKQAAC